MAFYVAGCLVSVGLWSITLYVPDKAMALLLLGLLALHHPGDPRQDPAAHASARRRSRPPASSR